MDIEYERKRFDFEIEVLIRYVWAEGDIKEVEIECFYPKKEERVSHFNKFGDTMSIVKLHLKLLFQRFIGMLQKVVNT